MSTVRTGLGYEAVTAANKAKHELGDKQKAPKSSPQQGAEPQGSARWGLSHSPAAGRKDRIRNSLTCTKQTIINSNTALMRRKNCI